MILHLLNGDVPALHRVTLRAIRPHLVLVHVGVAVLTILGHVRENRFDVALNALHLLVHASQRVIRFVVVEFRNGLDRPPCLGRVTVLARDRERSVRTLSASALALWKPGATCSTENKHPKDEFEISRRTDPPRTRPYLGAISVEVGATRVSNRGM